MWHVFEHIDNPVAFVGSLSKLLPKDGVIIFDIPNRNSIGFNLTKKTWFHLDTPRHLFYYSYDSMRALLEKHNFEIIKYKANIVDYFHDLSISFYMRFKKTNNLFLNIIIAAAFIPPTIVIRFLAALFVPSISEINAYVVKHKV